MSEVVGIKEITIIRREGPKSECGKEHKTDSWEGANEILFNMAWNAPKVGYDKVDFKIIFQDGQKYIGRYDLVHRSVEMPDLYKHIKNYIMYYAGKNKPIWMTEKQYRKSLLDVDTGEFEEFAKKYLGVN